MDEALIKRVLPHSIEAEQAVIGAMLMDKEAILTSSEIISGDDFYQSAYGVIFDAIVEIYKIISDVKYCKKLWQEGKTFKQRMEEEK